MSRLNRFNMQWATLMLVTILLMACGGKEERKAAYMERGKAYLAENNYGKANIEFKNVIQIDPKTAEAIYLIGVIAEKRKNWRAAFNNYQRAFNLDESLIEPRLQLARIYMAQAGALKARGDQTATANALALAQEHIIAIQAIEPDNIEAKTLESVMLTESGELEKAQAQLEDIVAKSPGQRSAVVVLSRIYENKELHEKAEQVLTNALVNKDERAAIQLSLVQFYARKQDMAAAEDVLWQLITENPEEDDYRNVLVYSLADNGRLDEAEKILRDHIKDDPEDPQRYVTLSSFLLSKRSEEIAINELLEVVAKKPELADVSFALAGLYLSSKDSDSARKVLEALIKRHGLIPTALNARSVVAEILFSEDPLSERAEALVATVLKENPSDNAALLLRGRAAALRKDFVGAIASFRAVLKDQPDSSEVIRFLAAAHLGNNEPSLARDTLVVGIKKNPQDIELKMSMVGVLIRENDIDGALEEIGRILAIDEFHDKALAVKFKLLAQKGDVAGLDQVTAQMQEGDPDDDAGFFREVQVRVAQKDYAAAQEILDKVLSKKPDSVPALVAKSHVLDKLKKYDEALVVVRNLQKVLPEHGEGYFREAKILEKTGELKAALQQYEIAYSKQADSQTILLSMAELEVKMGNRDSAEQRLKEVIANDASHNSAYNVLGLLYLSEKKFAEAEQAFESQLKNAPDTSAVYSQLASARLAQKNLEGAVQAYQDGLAKFENDTLMMIGFAGVRERQGFQEDAIGLYERVLEVQPGNAISTNNLASLLSDYRSDAKSLGRAKELALILEKTSQPAFRDTAGWVYYRLEEYVKAVEVLEKVVSDQPKIPVFNYHLGMALVKAGDKDAAKNYLKKATPTGAKYPGVEEARTTLDSL